MNFLSKSQWQLIYKIVRVLGFAGCLITFLLSLIVIGYYSATRPHSPQIELGWNVPLSWTHPTSYGTAHEEYNLNLLFWLYFPFFFLLLIGELIRIYILKDDP